MDSHMRARKKYTVHLELDEDAWWSAQLVELPECITQGRTLQQARTRIREALSLFIDDAAETVELLEEVALSAPARRKLDAYHEQRAKAEMETKKLRRASRDAAKALTRLGVSRRDAGALLGLSGGRVQQVLDGTR